VAPLVLAILILAINIFAYLAGIVSAGMAHEETAQFRTYIIYVLFALQALSFIILFQQKILFGIIFSVAALILLFIRKQMSATMTLSAISVATAYAGNGLDAILLIFSVMIVQGMQDYRMKFSKKPRKGFWKKLSVIKMFKINALVIALFSVVLFAAYYFIF